MEDPQSHKFQYNKCIQMSNGPWSSRGPRDLQQAPARSSRSPQQVLGTKPDSGNHGTTEILSACSATKDSAVQMVRLWPYRQVWTR